MFTVINFQFYNYSCASYDLWGANCSELDGQERYATPPLYSSHDFIPIFTWTFSVYYICGKFSLLSWGPKPGHLEKKF